MDGMEEKYIATHEFAHSLIDMEQSLKNYVGYDTKQFKRIRKEIKSIFDEYRTRSEISGSGISKQRDGIYNCQC